MRIHACNPRIRLRTNAQIALRKNHHQLTGILEYTPIAHLAVVELALDHTKLMLNLGSDDVRLVLKGSDAVAEVHFSNTYWFLVHQRFWPTSSDRSGSRMSESMCQQELNNLSS